MTYSEILSQKTVAISISESPDMSAMGIGSAHLREAMADIARHLLALGSRLAYGGDLRANGFSELLFELITRHSRDADKGDERLGVINYLAWPVHIGLERDRLKTVFDDIKDFVDLICLHEDGTVIPITERLAMHSSQSTDRVWSEGLTSMRKTMLAATDARIVLGGRVTNYRGAMPGIAEETLLSLQFSQPVYLLGGFGGCTRDIVETLGIIEPSSYRKDHWPGRDLFESYSTTDLCNGLTDDENMALVATPHIDQAITLILRGLLRLQQAPRN